MAAMIIIINTQDKISLGLFQIAQKQIYGTKLTNMVALILSMGTCERLEIIPLQHPHKLNCFSFLSGHASSMELMSCKRCFAIHVREVYMKISLGEDLSIPLWGIMNASMTLHLLNYHKITSYRLPEME